MATPDDIRYDGQGNPLSLAGCPNCGKGKRWIGALEWAAEKNSGRDPFGPCSLACCYQLEYQAVLEAQRLTALAAPVSGDGEDA